MDYFYGTFINRDVSLLKFWPVPIIVFYVVNLGITS